MAAPVHAQALACDRLPEEPLIQLLYPIGIAAVAIPLNIAIACVAPRPPWGPRVDTSNRPTIGRLLPATTTEEY